MDQLRIDEGDDMTPGGKGPRLLIDTDVLGQNGDEEGRNEIEELTENRQIRRRWRWSRFWFFHPCRVAVKPTSVSIFASQLWDGCGIFLLIMKCVEGHPIFDVQGRNRV